MSWIGTGGHFRNSRIYVFRKALDNGQQKEMNTMSSVVLKALWEQVAQKKIIKNTFMNTVCVGDFAYKHKAYVIMFVSVFNNHQQGFNYQRKMI